MALILVLDNDNTALHANAVSVALAFALALGAVDAKSYFTRVVQYLANTWYVMRGALVQSIYHHHDR